MKINRKLSRSRQASSRRISSQKGQTFLMIAVFIGVFLLGILGVATDYSQVWARRQMAQAAADAACQAGAADLFLNATDPSVSGQDGLQSFSWMTNGAFNCTSNAGSPPCAYASLNGYTGATVSVSFPSSLPNVTTLPTVFATPIPYIQVTVTDTVPMLFTKVLPRTASSVTIHATAGCGVVPVNLPVPMVILHPTASGAFSVGGASVIKIFGGAQRSVQVNSNSPSAVSVGTVNLSQGGPSNSGSDFAVFGGPSTKPGGINLGTTGHYIVPAVPIGDPFISVNAPTAPAANGTATPVPFAVNGCPDPNGCVEFTPGNYTGCTASGNIAAGAKGCLTLPYSGSNPKFNAGAIWSASHAFTAGTIVQPTNAQHNAGGFMYIATNSGTSGVGPNPWNQTVCTRQSNGTCSGGIQLDGTITWQNVGAITFNKLSTGIFDPGLYYVAANGLNFGDGSTARVSAATGDGSGGVMFYFSTSATVGVTSNSGKSSACTSASPGSGSPNGCVVSYTVSGAVSSAATGFVPSRALKCPSGASNPSQVPSVLDGNILFGPCTGTYASPDGNHGFLFFQNRSVSAQPSWGGGGQFLSSGFLYFHSGGGSTCGTNTTCLTLQGGSGSQSFTLGDVVVDKLSLAGNPQINMILNPTATFLALRPSLLQ
jgi:Flp pilus assembly protein TadG